MTKIEPLGAVRERVLATLREEIIASRQGPGDRLVDPARARAHALTHAQANHRSVVRHLFGTEGDL